MLRSSMDGCANTLGKSHRYARWRRALAWLLLLSIVPSAGCATSLRQWWHNGFKVGPNYERPAAAVGPQWLATTAPQVKCDPLCDCAWWTVFNDPTLNAVIESAYRQNLDLRTAGTRILQARAQRGIAVGNLFPQSQTALGTYAHAQISRNLQLPLPGTLNAFATGLNASWELDFWGRYRRAIEAADADLNVSVEDYGNTLVLLLSEVASSYVQLRTFEARIDFAVKNAGIQKGSLRLAEDRFQAGVATELDVRQAKSSLAQTEATIPPLIAGRRQEGNRLCILLGMPVSDLAGHFPSAPIPAPPLEVAVGIPADLLRRRPDVRMAERQVASQSAQIGIAAADLYPRLTLNGFVGYAASDLKDLFAKKSFIGFIVPTLQWNVLNYGRIANNIKVQDARLEAAALRYQQTVLTAGREVEDALVAFVEAQQQAVHLASGVQEAQRSVELVTVQFEGGVTDFNRVFNTQTLLVTQQDQLATTRGNIALDLIEVYRALGGGWQHFLDGQGMPRPVQAGVMPTTVQEPSRAEEVPAPVPTPVHAGPRFSGG